MRFLPWILLLTIALSVVTFHTYVSYNSEAIVTNKKNALLNEARLHFENLVNTRKWNAQYGGVYVKPVNGLKPNPYLQDNTLSCDTNRTLIKINPAWMTRQLSEIETIDNLRFTITSLHPLNPGNAPDAFEKEGLEYIEAKGAHEYYRFDDTKEDFHYIGALKVTKACLRCHSKQGYRLGDIRGGIHIALSHTDFGAFEENMLQRTRMILGMAYGLGFALLFVGFYAYRKHGQTEELNRSLESKVLERTQTLRQKQSILREMLDRQPDGILLMEGTRIIDTNQTLLKYCGTEEEKTLIRLDAFDTRIIPVEQEGYLQASMEHQHWSDYILNHDGLFKMKLRLPDGSIVFEVKGKRLQTDPSEHLKLISLSDITQHEQLVENLTRSALTDALTGVHNRKKFDEELESCLKIRLDIEGEISLIMIDIDFFKAVNDTHGHAVGDHLLKSFAGRVASLLREQDFLARWGGEEFVVILYHTSAEHAASVAEKLRRTVERRPFFNDLKITASFGVTQMYKKDTPRTVLERVDKALYEAKQSGRNRVVKI